MYASLTEIFCFFLSIFITPYLRRRQRKSPLVDMKETHEMLIGLILFISSVFLVQGKQLLLLQAEPLPLAANAPAQFWSNVFETFSPDVFLCGAFFVLANGHELLRFFDDIFKLKSTIYKRRTPRQARRIYQTWTFGNLSYAAICHATFNASLLLVKIRWLLSIRDNYAKKRFSFVTLHSVNLFS